MAHKGTVKREQQLMVILSIPVLKGDWATVLDLPWLPGSEWHDYSEIIWASRIATYGRLGTDQVSLSLLLCLLWQNKQNKNYCFLCNLPINVTHTLLNFKWTILDLPFASLCWGYTTERTKGFQKWQKHGKWSINNRLTSWWHSDQVINSHTLLCLKILKGLLILLLQETYYREPQYSPNLLDVTLLWLQKGRKNTMDHSTFALRSSWPHNVSSGVSNSSIP